MDTETKSAPSDKTSASGKRVSVIWRGLDGATRRLYARVIHGLPGRVFTSYRTVDGALYRGRRYTGHDRYSPMSPARQRVVEAAERSHLLTALRALSHYLFVCPAKCYGLFGLYYSLMAIALHAITPLADRSMRFDWPLLVTLGVLLLLSLPFVATKRSLAEVLGRSALGRLVFVRFLGIPQDRMSRTETKYKDVLPYLAFLLAIPAAGATVWIHPLWIPAGMLLLGLVGMICAYPEAGVILSTAMLPLLWVWDGAVLVLGALILLCWLSYGVKLLLLHRSFHLGLLDTVILIFGAVVLTAGMTGAVVSGRTVIHGVLLFVLLSDYFLITNLMTTRAHVRRCLVGVVTTALLVFLMGWIRLAPADSLDWLAGSRAGDTIVGWFASLRGVLTDAWANMSVVFLVLVQPFLVVWLMRCRRPRTGFFLTVFLVFNLLLLQYAGSLTVWVCLVGELLMFGLLYSHRSLAVSLVALPGVACGVAWATVLRSSNAVSAGGQMIAGSDAYRGELWQGVWRMIKDYPAGIGLGEEAFAAVYPTYAQAAVPTATGSDSLYFDLLADFSWGGLIIFGVLVLLFLQKSLTCVRVTGRREDRAILLGGVACMLGVLIMGIVRGMGSRPSVFFAFWLMVALCGAHANLVFDEYDALRIRTEEEGDREDRVYRLGL